MPHPKRMGRPSLFRNKTNRRTAFLSRDGVQALERHRKRLAEVSGKPRPTDSDAIEFALLGEDKAHALMTRVVLVRR